MSPSRQASLDADARVWAVELIHVTLRKLCKLGIAATEDYSQRLHASQQRTSCHYCCINIRFKSRASFVGIAIVALDHLEEGSCGDVSITA